VTAYVTAAADGVAATLLVLLLAHHTCTQPGVISAVETVPVGLLLGLSLAITASPPQAAIVMVVATLGMSAAIVDAHERRLPNLLTATLGAGLLVTAAAIALLTGNAEGFVRASVAAVVTVVVALVVKAARPSMLGWGDVKLLPSLAAALAWTGVSTLAQGFVGWIVLLLATTALWRIARFDIADTVPYGPALVLGTLGALLAGA
jgi:prepilin signal peptidase PulO-like enzyme (type II secretory pathway)